MQTQVNDNTVIYLPKKDIDPEMYSLAEKFSKSSAFNHIRIMPDGHSSAYCCVGMTSYIDNKVIPQIVGGDIGCGITVMNLNKIIKEKQYEKIDKMIKALVPMGEKTHKVPITNEAIMKELYGKCNRKLEKLKTQFPDYPYNDFNYNENYYRNLVIKTQNKISSSNYLKSMGTLGGGNHYIEINREENGNCYLCVHSGSRFMGQAICGFHQNKITSHKNYNKSDFLNCYLEGNDLVEYLIDMIFAQEFASKNRSIIVERICLGLGIKFDTNKIIETIHNYIDFDDFILRKGAISAKRNELCIISLNMKDGILICKGKGNPEWNYSSAHGCGRLMSGKDARASFNMKEYKKLMSDVYSTSVCNETLDEIPTAYKDVDFIKNLIGDSVEIIKQLTPVINVKGF